MATKSNKTVSKTTKVSAKKTAARKQAAAKAVATRRANAAKKTAVAKKTAPRKSTGTTIPERMSETASAIVDATSKVISKVRKNSNARNTTATGGVDMFRDAVCNYLTMRGHANLASDIRTDAGKHISQLVNMQTALRG